MHTLTDHELFAADNDHTNRLTQEEEKTSGWVLRLRHRIEVRRTGRAMLDTVAHAEERAKKCMDCGHLDAISGDALAIARHNGHCWLRDQK